MQMNDIREVKFFGTHTSCHPPSSFSGSYIELKLEITELIINCLLSFNKISFSYLFHHTETSFLVNHKDTGKPSQSEKQQFFSHVPVSVIGLLPLPASASPASAGRGPGSNAALRWAGGYVDLSLLDLAAGLWQQVLDLLLRFQVEHHVSELLLQLLYRHVLHIACRTNRRRFQPV